MISLSLNVSQIYDFMLLLFAKITSRFWNIYNAEYSYIYGSLKYIWTFQDNKFKSTIVIVVVVQLTQ